MNARARKGKPEPTLSLWNAPAERSGDGALVTLEKRRRSRLSGIAAAVQMAPVATNALRDIRPPLEIPSGWEWLWWAAAALVVLLLAFGLWHFLRKRKTNAPLPPLIPAHIRAKEKLQEALALISQPKPFCTLVSDTIRLYLEEQFNFRAPERTTEEFLHELRATDLLLPDQKESLGEFLKGCDLVKFARYEPGESELLDLHGAAFRLVEETEPQSELQATGENQIANHQSPIASPP